MQASRSTQSSLDGELFWLTRPHTPSHTHRPPNHTHTQDACADAWRLSLQSLLTAKEARPGMRKAPVTRVRRKKHLPIRAPGRGARRVGRRRWPAASAPEPRPWRLETWPRRPGRAPGDFERRAQKGAGRGHAKSRRPRATKYSTVGRSAASDAASARNKRNKRTCSEQKNPKKKRRKQNKKPNTLRKPPLRKKERKKKTEKNKKHRLTQSAVARPGDRPPGPPATVQLASDSPFARRASSAASSAAKITARASRVERRRKAGSRYKLRRGEKRNTHDTMIVRQLVLMPTHNPFQVHGHH